VIIIFFVRGRSFINQQMFYKFMKLGLLIVDCQNDFVKDKSDYSCPMLDSALIERIKLLIEHCRSKNIPIVYTQHSIKSDKSNAETGEPKEVRACIIGTEGWKIIDVIKPDKKDFVVMKDKFDAFYGTELHDVLKKQGIGTLIMCGVNSNNCVRSTSEGAYYRGYRLILVKDCCGAIDFIEGYSAKEINDISLNELGERTYDTQVLTLEQFKEKF
jgi:nicotinamidase-related amidase